MKKATCKSLLCALTLAALGLSMTACQAPITGERVRADITPELETLTLTPEQHKNRYTRTIDTNLRAIWDDIDEFLLLDRPVRLSKWPVP